MDQTFWLPPIVVFHRRQIHDRRHLVVLSILAAGLPAQTIQHGQTPGHAADFHRLWRRHRRQHLRRQHSDDAHQTRHARLQGTYDDHAHHRRVPAGRADDTIFWRREPLWQQLGRHSFRGHHLRRRHGAPGVVRESVHHRLRHVPQKNRRFGHRDRHDGRRHRRRHRANACRPSHRHFQGQAADRLPPHVHRLRVQLPDSVGFDEGARAASQAHHRPVGRIRPTELVGRLAHRFRVARG